MAHHGDKQPPIPEGLAKLMQDEAERMKLGPTHSFPQGKIGDGDDGELRIGLARMASGGILLNLGRPVAWVGLDAASARDLGEKLIRMADESDNG